MVRRAKQWHETTIERAREIGRRSQRSTYHYHSHKAEEKQLIADVEKVAGEHVTYGTRRIRSQLRRSPYEYIINRKRVQRIMRQRGLLRPQSDQKMSYDQQ